MCIRDRRWAEFIVFLKGSQQSGVNDLNVIDAEVCKVKEGSSKPAYGSEAGAVIEIGSGLKTGYSHYPRCNEIVCGVWPHIASIGHLLKSAVSYTHLRAHETPEHLVCRLLLEKNFFNDTATTEIYTY